MQTNAISPLIQQYTVDFAGNNNFLFVKGIQGDGYGTRYVDISLVNNGQPYTINNEAVTVVIRGIKPDNNTIFNKCEILDTNTIRVEITQQMSAVAGKSNYEISIMSNTENRTLTSFPFFIIISKSSFDIGYVVSSDEFGLLVEKINQVHKIQSDLSDLKSDMQDSIKNCDDATSDCIDTTNDARKAIGDMNTLHNSVTTAEATRVANENARINEENKRKNAEQTRISNENTRKSNETTRINNENSRKTEETARVNAENARESAENARITAENARNTNENNRITNENDRITNENDRENEETIRISSEATRNNEEIIRKNNENNRIANESVRQTNENTRQTDTTTAINRANAAAKACEDIIAGTGIVMQTEKGSSDGVAKLDSNAKIITNQLPEATNIGLGAVKIGNNITLSNGIISVIKKNIIDALGFTPINKSGDSMTGVLTVDMYSGCVDIFGHNNGSNVWLYDNSSAKNRCLQIMCKDDIAHMYLVDNTGGNATEVNHIIMNDSGVSIKGNVVVGDGRNNSSVMFFSPIGTRYVWAGYANSTGDFYIYDSKNNKSIIHSTLAGVTIFYGNATSATNADTVDGKHASDLQNYNNLTNRPTIPNSVAVKGNKENAYRQGNVNLTPANIGAVNTAGDTMAGSLTLNNNTENTPSINWISTLRHVWAGCVNSNGTWYLWDTTNSRAILQCDKNGNTLMQGNHLTVDCNETVKGLIASDGFVDFYRNGTLRGNIFTNASEDKFCVAGHNAPSEFHSEWNRTSGNWFCGIKNINNDWSYVATRPLNDNSQYLGDIGYRWKQLWAANATILTSDRNYKEEIEYLSDDYAKDIIMHLKPASFKFKNKDGDYYTHDRRHFGFIAQDIEDDIVDGLGMSSSDLGFFIKSPTKDIPDYEGDLDYIYSLRYEEFISVIVKTIQTQQNEIENQQKKISDLERRLEALEIEKN